jgi:hypothetical protein
MRHQAEPFLKFLLTGLTRRPFSTHAGDFVPNRRFDVMTEASVRFTEDFVVDALRHYRLQHRARRPILVLKALMTLLLAGLATVGFFHGPFVLGLLFVGLCLLVVYGHHIDLWLARRSLRRWAFRDETVAISFTDEGFCAKSPKQETMLRWPAFTRVVHFRDGFLLFHGPSSFHWIPVSALVGSTALARLTQLLNAKIPEHRIIEHVAVANDGPATPVGNPGTADRPPSMG